MFSPICLSHTIRPFRSFVRPNIVTGTDGLQFFLLPLVLGKSLVSLIVSNTLYAGAFSWYWYITHLGYRALPFLSQTEVFLFPIAAIALVYVLNLVGYFFGMGWNASRIMAHIYFD
mmetsp:Transcript_21442/g.43560  ORF Transcript_21442/g.43560 Transcript_21442/m.43560 type:complete len:116 (+) Transcript_21442:2-349(+)